MNRLDHIASRYDSLIVDGTELLSYLADNPHGSLTVTLTNAELLSVVNSIKVGLPQVGNSIAQVEGLVQELQAEGEDIPAEVEETIENGYQHLESGLDAVCAIVCTWRAESFPDEVPAWL